MIKTRFAPSPTGHLHLGNVRTALFSALFARAQGGTFLLRIEDTDAVRSRETFTAALLDDLRWLGLDWQEGPEVGGAHGPYVQSERTAIYDAALERLAARDLVYPCFCSALELEISRKSQLAAGRAPRYAGTCARLSADERAARTAAGRVPTLRFRVVKARAVTFDDLVRGPQNFASDDIGDFIVRRADGSAAFFFGNALDDALMGVTHVLRGEDHLSNTPRQLLLLEALELAAPRYGHLAMITGDDGGKLSKREGATGLHELRAAGYLPEAIANHLARLGHVFAPEHDAWMDLAGLAARFDLARLGRAPARFDAAQLHHWQAESVVRLDAQRLWTWMGAGVHVRVPAAQREAFVAAVRANCVFPADALDWAERLFGADPAPDAASREVLAATDTAFFGHARAAYAAHGADWPTFTAALKTASGAKGRALFMPLRAALTGLTHGPELALLLALLAPETVDRRLTRCRP